MNGGNSYPIGFDGQTGVICYPIYKYADNETDDIDNLTNHVIKLNVTSKISDEETKEIEIIPHQTARWSFEAANDETSYYYNIKISIIPPFDTLDPTVHVDTDDNLIIECVNEVIGNNIANLGQVSAIRTVNNGNGLRFALFCKSVQSEKYIETYGYQLIQNANIQKNDLMALQSPNPSYNPKLNGQNFKELKITAANGDSFTYDIQKLVEQFIVFEYSEPIVPEVTRYYMRVRGGTGLYVDQTDENYMGLVGSTDNSLLFTNDQYAAFLANNKNFFMQSNIKIGVGAVSGGIDAFKSAAYGKGAAVVSGLLSTAVNTGISLIDRSLTVDNMQNAPDQMKNANGNVIFNLFATELGLYVEEYSALDGDLKTANDFMDLYGFTFSSVGNVRDYANIRKYHNYIKAQLQSIIGNLSNAARNDLQQRFERGVRFWNSDTISYQYENYENWLDN